MVFVGLFFYLSSVHEHLFAKTSQNLLYDSDIDRKNIVIQEGSHYSFNRFSELYASKGEDYLILGDDQKALENFLLSYEYALKSGEGIVGTRLSFRSLFGVFLVYIRLEDLELAKETYSYLSSILDGWSCSQRINYIIGKCSESLQTLHGIKYLVYRNEVKQS